MLLCIVYGILFVDSVDMYHENLAWLLISLHAAYGMYRQCQHTLDLAKLAFSTDWFLVGKFPSYF